MKIDARAVDTIFVETDCAADQSPPPENGAAASKCCADAEAACSLPKAVVWRTRINHATRFARPVTWTRNKARAKRCL
jgi:hypothetical protein